MRGVVIRLGVEVETRLLNVERDGVTVSLDDEVTLDFALGDRMDSLLREVVEFCDRELCGVTEDLRDALVVDGLEGVALLEAEANELLVGVPGGLDMQIKTVE